MTAPWTPPPNPVNPPPWQDPTPPPSPPKRRLVWPWVVGGAALLLVVVTSAAALVWWFQPVRRLERADPDGYAACEALARALDGSDVNLKLRSLGEAGEHAQLARTNAIKTAVIESGLPAIPVVADPKPMTTACEDHGYDIPDVADATGEVDTSALIGETDPYSRTLVVEGAGPMRVTYTSAVDGTTVTVDVQAPWRHSLDLASKPTQGVSVVAQRGAEEGQVSCKITSPNGSTVYSTGSGAGAYRVVSCFES